MEDLKGLSDALRDIVEELKYGNELREALLEFLRSFSEELILMAKDIKK